MEQMIIDSALSSWRRLVEFLPTLREDQVKMLLDHEVANRKRKIFVEYLHQRYNKLRMKRERAELMEVFIK